MRQAQVTLFLTLLTGTLAGTFTLETSAAKCMDADLLLRNGHIVTMSASLATASSMAIRDGKILAVADNDSLNSCASPRTTIIDLHKQTVIPGLIDVHTHAMEWAKGILRGQIDAGYPNVHSISDIVKKVAERSAAAKSGDWIVGTAWDDAKLTERRYVTRQDLDAVSPNNPVYLMHVSGHLTAVNSAASVTAALTTVCIRAGSTVAMPTSPFSSANSR